MRITSNNWEDFQGGMLEYLSALRDLESDSLGDVLHMRDSERTNLERLDHDDVRVAWRSFVSDVVSPELAIHALKFFTLTFRDIRGQPPILTHGRKVIERFIAQLSPLVDSFVIVEERGSINDRLHYHGLYRYSKLDYTSLHVMPLLKEWERDNGFIKFEDPKSSDATISYTAKYLVKGQYTGDSGFWARRSGAELQIKMEGI